MRASSTKIITKTNITTQQLYQSHKKIALTEFYLPDALGERKDVEEFYSTRSLQLLKDKGFELLPPKFYKEEFEKQKKAQGGFFNSKTGQFDQQKYSLVLKSTLQNLKEKHGVDSLLRYGINIRKVQFGNFRAAWDGTSEAYEKDNSDTLNFLSSMTRDTHGYLPGLSFVVSISDLENNTLFVGAGGIELMSKLNSDDKFEDLPKSSLLNDREKLRFSFKESFSFLLDY